MPFIVLYLGSSNKIWCNLSELRLRPHKAKESFRDGGPPQNFVCIGPIYPRSLFLSTMLFQDPTKTRPENSDESMDPARASTYLSLQPVLTLLVLMEQGFTRLPLKAQTTITIHGFRTCFLSPSKKTCVEARFSFGNARPASLR